MPWVTINGNHVLIGEDDGGGSTGGGHTGEHNPAVSTGNAHTDKALHSISRKVSQKTKERNKVFAKIKRLPTQFSTGPKAKDAAILREFADEGLVEIKETFPLNAYDAVWQVRRKF